MIPRGAAALASRHLPSARLTSVVFVLLALSGVSGSAVGSGRRTEGGVHGAGDANSKRAVRLDPSTGTGVILDAHRADLAGPWVQP
jgi:hypothetical protein